MNEFLEARLGFILADPWMLLIGLAIPPVLWWRSRRREPAAGVGHGPLLDGIDPGIRARFQFLPRLLEVIAALLIVGALARPVVRERIPTRTEGVDILLAIDVSSSMMAKDMDVSGYKSRLDIVKEKAAEFIKARETDRIGILTFAAFPDLRCPLTLDQKALLKFISDIEPVRPQSEEDRTGIGLALARAATVLRNSEARSRVAVLLTDGQENVREIEPVDAARLAKEFGIRLYTIGAGRGNESLLGMRAIDFTELERTAAEAGGRFFRAEDAGALAETYQSIDRLEKTQLSDPRFRFSEKYYYLIGPALIAFLASLLLRHTILAVVP